MNNEWLKQLKPGDTVIVARKWGDGVAYHIAKVNGFTPAGWIKIECMLYDGHTGVSRSGLRWLLNYNDQHNVKTFNEYVKYHNLRMKIESISYKLTYDQIDKIVEILGWE